MKGCRKVKKEIDLMGSAVPGWILKHLETCESCSKIFKLQERVDSLLSLSKEVEAPSHFKRELLRQINPKAEGKISLPRFVFALKSLGVIIILLTGFWVGMRIVNGNYSSSPPGFDLMSNPTYKMMAQSVPAQNLARLYFTALEGEKIE